MRRRTINNSRRKKRDLGRYKSGLEKYCADQLSEFGIPFCYEEVSYTLQEAFNYSQTYWKMTSKKKEMINRSNGRVLPITYTPDFTDPEGRWIIETKGYNRQQHTFPLRWKMFLKHLNEAGPPYPALFMPKNKDQIDHTIQMIKRITDESRRAK